MTPFFSQNDQTAERSFQHAVNQPDSIIGANPGDYSLYKLADFMDDSGEIQPIVPAFVANPKVKP